MQLLSIDSELSPAEVVALEALKLPTPHAHGSDSVTVGLGATVLHGLVMYIYQYLLKGRTWCLGSAIGNLAVRMLLSN